MKKIGLLLLALVVALGALGVGYAMWSDTIYIDGTVNTGTVDLDITGYSATYVYKDFNDIEDDGDYLFISSSVIDNLDQINEANDDYMLVAYAAAAQGTNAAADEAGDSVQVTFANLFPLANGTGSYCADVKFQYNGSIPVHFAETDWVITGDDASKAAFAALVAADFVSYEGYVDADKDGEYEESEYIEDIDELQLHQGDQGMVKMCITIPQNPENYPDLSQANLSGKSVTFSFSIIAHQWNETYTAP